MNKNYGNRPLTPHPSPLTLQVDGAARGNPGPAGIGIFLKDKDGQVLLEEKEYIGHKTNNEAEYTALIIGLERASSFGNKIEVISDSELMVKQINGIYKVKQNHLKELYSQVQQKAAHFVSFKISHCYRESNKEADKLANEAIDQFNEGQREEFKLDTLKQEKLF